MKRGGGDITGEGGGEGVANDSAARRLCAYRLKRRDTYTHARRARRGCGITRERGTSAWVGACGGVWGQGGAGGHREACAQRVALDSASRPRAGRAQASTSTLANPSEIASFHFRPAFAIAPPPLFLPFSPLLPSPFIPPSPPSPCHRRETGLRDDAKRDPDSPAEDKTVRYDAAVPPAGLAQG